MLDSPVLEEDGRYLIVSQFQASAQIVRLVLRVKKAFQNSIEKFQVNTVDQNDDCDIESVEGLPLELVIKLPIGKFYKNIEAFVKESSQLSMGELREDFYLVDEDYLAGEEHSLHSVSQLEKLCAWIGFLQAVLPHTETRVSWLTFILFPESVDGNGRSKKTFKSKIRIEDLSFDLSKIKEFLEIAGKEDLHASERKSVFRQALAELLESQHEEDRGFSHILKNINKLHQTYHDNYERYINGFSMEKLKKEVMADYYQFSLRINSALNDIVTKVFAVPASLVAVALLIRLDNLASHVVMTLVVLLTSVVCELMLSWQATNICMIKGDIKSTFGDFSNSGASGAEFARKKQIKLNRSTNGVAIRILLLRWLSLFPVFTVGAYFCWKYAIPEMVWDWVCNILDRILSAGG